MVEFLKKIWEFLKRFWQLLLGLTIALVVTIYFLTRPKPNFEKQLEDFKAAHETQIKTIREAIDEERHRHAENVKQLQDAMAESQRIYDESLKRLEEQRGKNYERIIQDHEKDPLGIAKKFAETFNLKYVEPEAQK